LASSAAVSALSSFRMAMSSVCNVTIYIARIYQAVILGGWQLTTWVYEDSGF
jgi:hypothetical protein